MSEDANSLGKRERRKHFRILYRPNHRPLLKIKEQTFEIADISQGGLRLLNAAHLDPEDNWIHFTAVFLDGAAFEMVARIVWRRRDEFGLQVTTFFPSERINKERQYSD
jgi:hypothetical protein